MEWLSLQEPAPPPAVRPTRAEAVVISLAAHLLLFLLFLVVPERLPVALRRLLQGSAARATPLATGASPTDGAVAPEDAPRRVPENKIPLKFAYVRVPDDVPSPKNPDARLFSDKDRRARQEVPTPPDARRFSIDPHAEGDSRERVRPDPSRPEGPEVLEQVPPPAGSRQARGGPEGPGAKAQDPERKAGSGVKPRSATSGAGAVAATIEPSPEESGDRSGAPTTNESGREGAAEESEGPPGDPSRQAPADLRGRTEYKFSFNNPGWLAGGGVHGTLSFDTQGFPWGDYARQLQIIIGNNWRTRLPLAYREGIAGYTCQRFVIAKNGEILSIDVVHPSAVPPFNRAAGDALRASSPLPPLPEEFPNPQEGVTGCFYYNMYPGEAD